MQLHRFACASAMSLAGALALGGPAFADDQPIPDDEPPQEPPPEATLPPAPLPEIQAKTVAPRTGKRKPTGTFTIGAGMSPDDGAIFHAAIEQPDLFRTGQRLAMSADMSAIRQRFAIHYDVPEILPNTDLRTEIFMARRDFGAFTREGAGGQLGLAYKIDKHTQIYGRYRFENVKTELATMAQKPSELSGLSAANLGNGNVATLGAGIVHDSLDERYLPRNGTRFELSTDRADKRWGSDYNFERTAASLDHARSLGGGLTLRIHGHAAYVKGEVPLSERLQHDGHAEVRGYALDSLPQLGSNIEAIGRVELEQSLWSKAGLSLVGWADAGARHNTDVMFGPTDTLLQHSLGAGLIWRSPIGPIRFDVAFPLDGKDRDRQYLFGLGGWWW